MTDPAATPVLDDALVLDRLRHQHRRIADLFESYALRSLSPSFSAAESARLVAQTCALLDLHALFEIEVLHPTLMAATQQRQEEAPRDARQALARCAHRRTAVLVAAQQAEQAHPAAQASHGMARLALQVSAWFDLRERELLPMLLHAGVDPALLEPRLEGIEQALPVAESGVPLPFDSPVDVIAPTGADGPPLRS